MADSKKKNLFSRSKLTGRKLLSKGKQNAREFLNKLSDKEKIHILLTCEPKYRINLLSLISKPEVIVKSLPEDELYWTIKESGINKSIPMIAMTSPDQLHFIFDIEWWTGDTLNIRNIYHWLKILLKCGESKVCQWFETFDYDLIVLTFKKFLKIHKPFDGTDDYGESIEGLPSFTFDGIYFIEFTRKGCEDLIKKILTILAYNNRQLFTSIMEMLIWGIDAEIEEDSFMRVQRRLEDKGIPDFEEAMNVYRRISLEEIEKIPARDTSEKKNNKIRKSFYPIRLGCEKNLFITKVLEKIDNFATIETLSLNLARVANKVIIADRFALNNYSSFKEKLIKTTGIINIGLEILSQNDETKGIDEINSRWMEQLFSIGWNRILDIKKNSIGIIEILKQNFSDGIEILDFPFRETLKGIIRNKPLFFAGKTEDDCNNFRDFRSIEEIKITQDRINQSGFLADIITKGLGLSIIKSDNNIRWYDYENKLSFSSIFMTSFANKITKNRWELQYLDLTSMQVFINSLFGTDKILKEENRASVNEEILSDMQKLIGKTLNSTEKNYLQTFVNSCLDKLEKEYKESTEDGFMDIVPFKTLLIQHLDIY